MPQTVSLNLKKAPSFAFYIAQKGEVDIEGDGPATLLRKMTRSGVARSNPQPLLLILSMSKGHFFSLESKHGISEGSIRQLMDDYL